MATISPTPNIFPISLNDIRFSSFLKYKIAPRVATVIKSLNHTSNPSFNVMSLPSMPVKPARKTAI